MFMKPTFILLTLVKEFSCLLKKHDQVCGKLTNLADQRSPSESNSHSVIYNIPQLLWNTVICFILQQSADGPYPEPVECSLYPNILCVYYPF